MPDIVIHNVENKALFMGNNDFEYGELTVPANTTVPGGALLKRLENGKFAPIEANDEPLAVNPFPVKNTAAAPADISFRALISGKVRRDMLSANAQSITDAQADMLRHYGIIAETVYNTARLDNQ